MGEAGMAKHSESAFNEKSATRMLSDYLEQKNTISTFFKENDRTPNYDGSFELVGEDKAPTKQFIVQIKKAENLKPNVKGVNKDCYMYALDTSFLYYVKEKVIESPAIFFVVDIVTKNIFWLYLSDELLMRLDFEGKERVSYPFKVDDIVPDIDSFVLILKQIAAKRNTFFLRKTPEQISEMQDALDYINRLMENDFAKIKDSVFPNLWRFGIKYTPGKTMSISTTDHTITSESTTMFALYPQIKGEADTGLKEYFGNELNIFNHFDMLGKTTPMVYTRDTLHKIIKLYFENEIPAAQLPNILILERMGDFVLSLQRFYEFNINDGKILISDLYRVYVLLIRYIQHIVFDSDLDENETNIKLEIITRLNRGEQNFFDIFHCSSKVVERCKMFCIENEHEEVGFKPDLIFKIISKYQIEFYADVVELQERSLEYFYPVWKYDYLETTKLEPKEFIVEIDKICEKWFSQLPSIYNNCFDSLFEKNKYRFTGKFEYCNKYISNGRSGPWFASTVREYDSNDFSITYNPRCSESFNEEDEENGLLYIHNGFVIERFLQRKRMLYDSVRCLLYQGICKELGYESMGLSFNGMNYKLF